MQGKEDEGNSRPKFTPRVVGNPVHCQILGQPVCRTKLPRKVLTSKRKMVRKTTRNFPEEFLSLVLLCRISHRHYSKIFHREFPHKIQYFFTTRICRHGHANKFLNPKNVHADVLLAGKSGTFHKVSGESLTFTERSWHEGMVFLERPNSA